MLQKFSVEDAAVAGSNTRIPQWSMKMLSVGSKALVRPLRHLRSSREAHVLPACHDHVPPPADVALPGRREPPAGELPVLRAYPVGVLIRSPSRAQYLVNQPIDPAAAAYYQQQQFVPPLGPPPHLAAGGNNGVPLYDDNDEKIPAYTAPAQGTYIPHEKERFEDIRV